MRKEVVLPEGKTLWLEAFTGEVVSERAWTETKISSHNTVGYVNSAGVSVGGGQKVTSQTIDKKQIWLRGAAGDKCFDFTNVNLNVLPGHKLTVIDGGCIGLEKTNHFYIDLPTTDQYFDLFDKKNQTGYLIDLGLISIPSFFLRIALAAIFFIILVMNNFALTGFAVFFGTVANEFYFLPKKRKPTIDIIKNAIESIKIEAGVT